MFIFPRLKDMFCSCLSSSIRQPGKQKTKQKYLNFSETPLLRCLSMFFSVNVFNDDRVSSKEVYPPKTSHCRCFSMFLMFLCFFQRRSCFLKRSTHLPLTPAAFFNVFKVKMFFNDDRVSSFKNFTHWRCTPNFSHLILPPPPSLLQTL